jgi:outer membrane autotransporter protein
MRKQLVRRKLLLAVLAAGALYMPVMAEGTITSLVTVKDPNQTISDDIHVTDGETPSAVYIPKNMSGGEILIHSKNITVHRTGNDNGDYGLIDFDNGYKGKLHLADGMTMTGTFSGTQVRATGLTFNDVNELADRNTGKPGDGYVSIGDDVTIRLENRNENTDDKNPVTSNYLRGLEVTGETVETGDNLKIGLTAHTGNDAEMEGINIDHYGSVSIGDHARISVENYTKGPMGHNLTDIIFSSLQFNGEKSVESKGRGVFRLGNSAEIIGTYTSDDGLSEDAVVGQEFEGIRLEHTQAEIGDSALVRLEGSGSARLIKGLSFRNDSDVTIGDNLVNQLSMSGMVEGMYGCTVYGTSSIPSILRIGKNSQTRLSVEGPVYKNQNMGGISASYSTVDVEDGAKITVKAVNTGASAESSFVAGARSLAGNLNFGNNPEITVNSTGYNKTRGLYASNSSTTATHGDNLIIGDNLNLQVSATENGQSSGLDVKGLFNSNAGVTVGKYSRITVKASSDASTAMGLYSELKGTTTIGDDASIVVNSDAVNDNHVLHAESGGAITLAGSAYIQGKKEAAYADGEGSRISLMGSGKKTILGDLTSKDKGTILLDLFTSDSLIRGKSSVLDASGKEDVHAADTELSLSGGALWQMTGSSSVTKLANNGGTVDMQYNPDYQDLHIGTFSGNNGVFKMKSDLESQTDGDKVTIDNAEAGSTGIISVYDKSLATGKEVTGARHLLMVTDSSKNAAFRGESISTGGLWEIAPTIREGGTFADGDGNTVGSAGEWYLASVTRTINKDTKPLIDAGDNTYGLYRLSIDTLRQRLGDLRYRNRSDDKYDFWVRDRHGRFDGSGYDSKYNFFQIGVDTMPNEKSAYGLLVERGIAAPNFTSGSGKNHTLAGALYATWIGDHGSYTDVVAKIGRNDTTLHTYGEYADRASYREDEESLSIEYGKTLDMGTEGYFFEPQAQFVFGHLGSNSYTTRRGTHVHEDSFNSSIGRLGFVLGKKQKNGENPHDFYLKASILHEFGGDRDYSLRRVNAYGDEESLDGSYHYRDTWVEAGFGGNVKINDNTSFYADVERSFGSDYTKKWQINAGINWSF